MICFDTETTGLLAPSAANLFAQPHMIEIYCIKFERDDFIIVDEFYSLVKPPILIPEGASKANGIYDDMVKDAPEFMDIYEDLCNFFLGENEVVGHNIGFDLDVLGYELQRVLLNQRFPWPTKLFDTVEISYPIENKRLTLGKLHEHCKGKPIEGAHRAKADVMANARCFRWLVENGYVS